MKYLPVIFSVSMTLAACSSLSSPAITTPYPTYTPHPTYTPYPSDVQTLEPTPTPDLPAILLLEHSTAMAGWRTCVSPQYGFAIAYLPNWTVTKGVNSTDETIYLSSSETFGEGPEPISYYVFVHRWPNPEKLPYQEAIIDPLGEPLKSGIEYTQGWLGAYKFYEATGFPSRSGALSIFFEAEEHYTTVSLTPYDRQQPFTGQAKYEEIFRKMLLTFQFLSQ